MDEATAQAIQTMAAILSVTLITVTFVLAHSHDVEQTIAIVGSAFVLIGALLGVHVGVRQIRENGDG